MMIWVDADACPTVVKDAVFRASARLRLPVRETHHALTSTNLDHVPASIKAVVRPRDGGYAVPIDNRSAMARDPDMACRHWATP